MGRGVAVATSDRHPRLGQPQLRPDDVDDALPAAVQVEEGDAELLAILDQVGGHLLSERIAKGPNLRGGGDDVIDRREGPLRETDA